MTGKPWLMIATALGASLVMSGAQAAPRTKLPPPAAIGCTHPVAPFCIGVTTAKRQTLALFGANPFIALGSGIVVWGTPTTSPCGPGIQVTRWAPNPRLKCPR
jgi:hypothetical protein